MSLDEALVTGEVLREALGEEVHRAVEEREHLKSMDANRLLERASLRERFNHRLASLERELVRQLAGVQAMWGLDEVTVAAVAEHEPVKAAKLGALLDAIKANAKQLSAVDALNRQLAEKSLIVVRAYLAAVQPRASAYTRSGMQTVTAPQAHTHSWRG